MTCDTAAHLTECRFPTAASQGLQALDRVNEQGSLLHEWPAALLKSQTGFTNAAKRISGGILMRWFLGIVVALLVAIRVYVGSAVVSLNSLANAARAGDGAAVLARTDTARVRRSLVDQIVSAYLEQLGQKRPIKPLE